MSNINLNSSCWKKLTFSTNFKKFVSRSVFWPQVNTYINLYIAVNNAVEKCNSRNKALSIATLTLYTNIPHNKLEDVMRELIHFCFNDGEKQFIPVTKFDAAWTDNKNKFKIIFDKGPLKPAINFLLDDCYSNFGNLSIWKITGISIGSNQVPSMANLFLHSFENKWQLDNKKRVLRETRLFSNTFRFIDACLS